MCSREYSLEYSLMSHYIEYNFLRRARLVITGNASFRIGLHGVVVLREMSKIIILFISLYLALCPFFLQTVPLKGVALLTTEYHQRSLLLLTCKCVCLSVCLALSVNCSWR